MKQYDVIIIGGGPAGLTAGIYAGRRALATLLITIDVGGQTATTPHIENYPGFAEVTGKDLSAKMLEQAKKFGAEILLSTEVKEIKKEGDSYIVKANGERYSAQAIILAFGKTPRQLEAKGGEKYQGKGISYCANCDGPLFKGKTVAVVGGGNSALDAALFMAKIAKKVYLIHRRDQFRGDEVLAEAVKADKNIELVLDSTVTEILGNEVVDKMKVKNVKTNEIREIELEGIFVEVGFEVKADFIKKLVKVDERDQIVVDIDCRTSSEGIFAAGDLTQIPYKQIVIAAGQGAIAALSAYDYIQRKHGRPTARVDWGIKK